MVTRSLGDGFMKGPGGTGGPLTAEPEVSVMPLTAADDFLVLATDGEYKSIMAPHGSDISPC
eukprot:1181369-Prorocentrum_minimum.AAC.3